MTSTAVEERLTSLPANDLTYPGRHPGLGQGEVPTITAAAGDVHPPLERRAEIIPSRSDADLDLHLLLKGLGERPVTSILLIGGSILAGSFLAAGLIDRVVA